VKDASGNLNTCSFTVTVNDSTAPVITCPGPQTFCKQASSSFSYTVPPLVASDNCGISTTTYVVTGATSRNGSGNNASGKFNLGVSTITWTVKDAAGNTSVCSTTVTLNNCATRGTNDPGPTEVQENPDVKVPVIGDGGLKVKVSPNPTENYFRLTVQSSAKEAVEIKVYDMSGKLLQQLKGAVDQTFLFGDRFVSGAYIAEVRQGSQRVTVKVIKQ
jgi:hypothetical protein